MTSPDIAIKLKTLENVLTRAGEKIGDLTQPVMQRYYKSFPAALAAFKHHGLGNQARLETEMIDTVLYCIMTWLERPVEVAIMLYGSVPHHNDTLQVTPQWFTGLLDAAIDLIAETIPDAALEERDLIEEIRAGLSGAIKEAVESGHLRTETG